MRSVFGFFMKNEITRRWIWGVGELFLIAHGTLILWIMFDKGVNASLMRNILNAWPVSLYITALVLWIAVRRWRRIGKMNREL